MTNPSPMAKTEQEGPHTCGGYAPSPDCRGCFPMPLRWIDGDDDPVWLSVQYHPEAGGGQRDAESADVVECLSANPQLRAAVLEQIEPVPRVKMHLSHQPAEIARAYETTRHRAWVPWHGLSADEQESYTLFVRELERIGDGGTAEKLRTAESELAAERARVVELEVAGDQLAGVAEAFCKEVVALALHNVKCAWDTVRRRSPQQPSPPAEPQQQGERVSLEEEASCNALNYWSTRARELDESASALRHHLKTAESERDELRAKLQAAEAEREALRAWKLELEKRLNDGYGGLEAKVDADLAMWRIQGDQKRAATTEEQATLIDHQGPVNEVTTEEQAAPSAVAKLTRPDEYRATLAKPGLPGGKEYVTRTDVLSIVVEVFDRIQNWGNLPESVALAAKAAKEAK